MYYLVYNRTKQETCLNHESVGIILRTRLTTYLEDPYHEIEITVTHLPKAI